MNDIFLPLNLITLFGKLMFYGTLKFNETVITLWKLLRIYSVILLF